MSLRSAKLILAQRFPAYQEFLASRGMLEARVIIQMAMHLKYGKAETPR